MLLQASHLFIAIGRFKLELQSGNAKFGSKLAIWWMTLENNKAPYLTYFKLCASLHGHRSIQTRVTVRKRQIRVKIGDFCPMWPWNRTDDLEQGKSEGFDSCDWPSNLTQTGFKSYIFQPVWPWNLMDDLENNRAPLLYYIKLCASFQVNQWIQTGVTVWKRLIQVKIGDFLSWVTLKFDGWPWKTVGHLFYVVSSFGHHSIAIGKLKFKLLSGNAQLWSNLAIFCPVWLWNLTDDLEKQ